MTFKIQVGTPIAKYSKRKEYSFDEALQNIFLLHTENVIIYWNYCCIPLDYKYTISDIFNDILTMLESLTNQEEGEKVVTFFENSFHTKWLMTWDKNNLTIIAEWYSVSGAEEMLNILTQRNKIIINKSLFISEWKMLLSTVKNNLLKYYLHARVINGFDKLISIEKKIKNKGCFYTKNSALSQNLNK